MKRIAIAAAIAAALCSAAGAADLPTKASPFPALGLGPYTGQGFYVGVNFGGAAGTVTGTTTVGSAQFTQANGFAGLTLGYAWAMGQNSFAAIEADFDAMGQSANTGIGLSLNGPASFTQRVLYGGPFDQLLAILPGFGNLQLPPFAPLPAGAVAKNSHIYGFVGLNERDISNNFGLTANKAWVISPELGIGNRTQYSNGFATDVSMAVRLNDKSVCVVSGQFGQGCAGMNPEAVATFKLLY